MIDGLHATINDWANVAAVRSELPVIRPRSTVGSKQRLWTNLTTDHPDDWDVAVGILFPNYAALHCGSRDTMIDAGKKRNELREVVASKLAREMLPK